MVKKNDWRISWNLTLETIQIFNLYPEQIGKIWQLTLLHLTKKLHKWRYLGLRIIIDNREINLSLTIQLTRNKKKFGDKINILF